ncbi:MAG TPA: hypothetical protein VFS21_37635, partial [Roseiflexaceae bacterium]|nr:hypothetical protein [Roseiflexaceae bacterium]
MAPESLTFSVAALPLELRPDGAHAEDRWVPWFSGLNEPVRFLAWTDPFDMETPRQRLRAARQPLDQAAQGYAPIAAIVESWDRQAVQRLERAMGLLPPALRTVLLAVLPQAGWDHRAVWQRALAQLGRPLWRRDWLKAYERFYGVLAEHGELRTVKHALMTWPSHGERPATAATMLSQALGTTVRPDTLPPFLPGTYTDAFTHLQPHDPQHPYLALLVAD